jgi:alpha-mannosidase
VTNDGTYASSFNGEELQLSLMRSPAYSALPLNERPYTRDDRFINRIDMGVRTFSFWVNAGRARERLDTIDREALVRNEKPFALSFFPGGEGGPRADGPILSDSVVVLTALKKAEKSDAFVLRLQEPTGVKRRTRLRFERYGIDETVTLGPFEIKTFLLGPGIEGLQETDIIEGMRPAEG